jgi:hypothetical protein
MSTLQSRCRQVCEEVTSVGDETGCIPQQLSSEAGRSLGLGKSCLQWRLVIIGECISMRLLCAAIKSDNTYPSSSSTLNTYYLEHTFRVFKRQRQLPARRNNCRTKYWVQRHSVPRPFTSQKTRLLLVLVLVLNVVEVTLQLTINWSAYRCFDPLLGIASCLKVAGLASFCGACKFNI